MYFLCQNSIKQYSYSVLCVGMTYVCPLFLSSPDLLNFVV
jgi:hypothetical protein